MAFAPDRRRRRDDRAARFGWDFIVGDDRRVAAGLAVALGLTYVLAHNGVDAWWLLPLAVVLLLAGSCWRLMRNTT